jgi:hypothetical protein
LASVYGDWFGRRCASTDNDRGERVRLLLNLGRTEGVIVGLRGVELPVWVIEEVGKDQKAYHSHSDVQGCKTQ